MINLTELIRNQQGLLSKEGLKYTFLYPDVYAAAALQDFLKERGDINSSWKSRMKINYYHTLMASVFIKSCRYQPRESSWEFPTPQQWEVFKYEFYADECIKSFRTGTSFNLELATMKFLDRFKNGMLYDTASTYPIIAKIAVPQDITIYNVWLKYIPQTDLAEIESFDEHDHIKVSDLDSYSQKQAIRNLLPQFEPA